MDTLIDVFNQAQQWLYEQAVQPVLFGLGQGNLLEDGYQATGWLLMGLLQLVVISTVFAALERWRPVEAVTDRRAVRVDVLYTLLHRLGLFRVLLFFTVEPVWNDLFGLLRVAGLPSLQLDQAWPGITDIAWVSFLLYLVVFDAVDYLLHRAQHRFSWWWQLHALHHSQRQMTVWSDNRNHLLDDVLRDGAFVAVALLIGVAPGQFVALVAVGQLLESLSHANVRLHFGPVLGRLLVSPRFHRSHHAMGAEHELAPAGGHNFAVLFPVWDLVFRTARFDGGTAATGVADQLRGRDYGRGFWAQQWRGVQRLAGGG